MFFKRRVTVPQYCETRLNMLFSPEQTKIWTSFKSQSIDAALRDADSQMFLDNIRAAHLQLLTTAINKTYMNMDLFSEVSNYIGTYLEQATFSNLGPIKTAYNSAFGSSPADGILVMAQLLSARVAAGRLSQDTIMDIRSLMYAGLASFFGDFKKVKIVTS